VKLDGYFIRDPFNQVFSKERIITYVTHLIYFFIDYKSPYIYFSLANKI